MVSSFFFWLRRTARGILVPRPEIELRPRQWKRQVLITRPPGRLPNRVEGAPEDVGGRRCVDGTFYPFPLHPQFHQTNSTCIDIVWHFTIWALCNISFGERIPLLKKILELENRYSRANTGSLFLTDSGGILFGNEKSSSPRLRWLTPLTGENRHRCPCN